MNILHYKNALKLNLSQELEKNRNRVGSRAPFQHQISAHSKLSALYSESGKRAILVLPTGAGKTYTTVYWLLKNQVPRNVKILWIADLGFLLEQAFETFRENILEVPSVRRSEIQMRVVSGSDRHANGNSISINDDIVFITAQTAISYWDYSEKDDDGNPIQSSLHKFVDDASSNNSLFIVYDEAHHTPAFGRRNLLIGGSEGKTGLLEKYPSFSLLGLTATPTYTDDSRRGWLWEIFKDGIVHESKKKDLEEADILAIPDYQPQKTDFNFEISDADLEKIKIRHQEIPERIIEKLAENEERNDFIAKFYVRNREKFGKTIIFVDRWYQCRTIENKINRESGAKIAASVFSYVDRSKSIDYINSRTSDENDMNLEKFRRGEIQVLLNVRMLTEGVDVPDVKTVFITRETNSKILFEQMVGRALRGRKAGGNKKTANIVFFIDNWSRHILFAGTKISGDTADEKVKERGYRPFELMSIELIDRLIIETEKQNFDLSYIEMVPVGWYTVNYSDIFVEEIDGKEAKSLDTFNENVLIYSQEADSFSSLMKSFNQDHFSSVWEKEELDRNRAEESLSEILTRHFGNLQSGWSESLKMRLIQICRHLGQNRSAPLFYTFEQREDLNLRKYVEYVIKKDLSESGKREYLDSIYNDPGKPLIKVVFPDLRDFKRAFNYEMEVYDNELSGKLPIKISGMEQTVTSRRLAPEEIRKIVFSRDENTCLCCGKSSNLQTDHIVSAKHMEPVDDSPELYQTLCGTCNKEKSVNSFNYRITNFQEKKMSVRNVASSSDSEPAVFFLTRLVNCYYATNAVQKKTVHAENQGNSIWKLKLKKGSMPEKNILKDKEELVRIIKKKGYRLKDLIITED